ncbi:MAG: PTS glucose transporter subunit IIA [Selenomonadaceae bacterium]|nr:PTS glucose transporter subunit IIA [Selenomonadaceae bacterium]
MFGLFKSSKTNPKIIYCPVKGKSIDLKDVKDDVFSTGMMGKGIAIIPEEGKVYSPCDGEVTMTFPTGHALGIESVKGAEILIHIGIDTVKMNGAGFDIKVQPGQKVKRGELLIEFSIDEIKKAGFPPTTPVIITNPDEFPALKPSEAGDKEVGDVIITL